MGHPGRLHASLKSTHHQLLAPKVNALLEHRSEKPERSFTQEKVVGSLDRVTD